MRHTYFMTYEEQEREYLEEKIKAKKKQIQELQDELKELENQFDKL